MNKLWLVIGGLMMLIWAVFGLGLGAPADNPAWQSFTVAEGAGFRQIAAELHDVGLIKSPAVFKFYLFLSGRAHRLKPGQYLLDPSWSAKKIAVALASGPAVDIAATIIEGETATDINARLKQLGILPAGEELSFKLEGYLFPDTYRFFPNSSLEEITKKFSDNFASKVGQIDLKNLIMASLIEKEVPLAADRHLVSGILWKRIKEGVPLQVDAAICYAKLKSFNGCYPLRRGDFSIDSRYNTYKYYGLPPAPIGNPGLGAIRAALNPHESPYWYYLSDPKTKRTIFAETLEEHNENRGRYLGL